MKTRATSLSMPSAMGATAALTFGSPAVLAIAGATAVGTYAWRMALGGPYMALRPGKGTAGDLVKAATKQAEAVVGATLKAVEEVAEVAADVSETAVETSVQVIEDVSEAVVEAAQTGTVVDLPVANEVKARPAPDAAKAEPAPKADTAPAAADNFVEAAPAQDLPQTAQPKALKGPRNGVADDLSAIKGIGPKLAEKLGEMGIYHYSQIAAWSEAEVAWMDENLGRPTGRVSRDNWVAAAAALKG